MVSDETLVREAVDGNSDAFEELVRRHYRRMFRLAWILTRGDPDAEDLVQETFVRAYRALGRFRGDSTFRTWMQRIAVNVINSHLAQRRRRVSTLPLVVEADGAEAAIDRLTSSQDLETDIVRRQLIDRALASLSDDLRLLIALREVHGFAYHEIAALMRLPMGTVESRIFRARRRLRPMLAPLVGISEAES